MSPNAAVQALTTAPPGAGLPGPSPASQGIAADPADVLLRVNGIEVIYNHVILVLNGVSLQLGEGQIAAILGGNVTVGGSGFSEFAEYISTGKMKPIGVTSGQRLKGVDVPTLKEQGINVEIGNWRGVYGAPGITKPQRDALVAMLEKATKSKAWAEALQKNDWTPAWLASDAFGEFVDQEFASLRATMVKSGMV